MANTQNMSPQGYNIQQNPYNENPFWEHETGEVAATVDVGTVRTQTLGSGIPASVSVTNSGDQENAVLDFEFNIPVGPKGDTGATGSQGPRGFEGPIGPQGPRGLTGSRGEKGEKGDTGEQGPAGENGKTPRITVLASVLPIAGETGVSVTSSGTDETPEFKFNFWGLGGEKGDTGATPDMTINASILPMGGIPSVEVEKSGTPEEPVFDLTFNGLKGNPPNITVSGSILPIGGSALPIVTVTKTGTDEAPNFDFQFANLKGEKGDTGNTGQTGATPNMTITASVLPIAGIPDVTVTKTGTAENPDFALQFSGLKGETGATGPAGPGVPTGGTAGQVLTKVDGTNYNAEWRTPSGGGINFKDLTVIKDINIPMPLLSYDIYISGAELTNLYSNYSFIKIEFFLRTGTDLNVVDTILNVPIGKNISNFPGTRIESIVEDNNQQEMYAYYAEESNGSINIGFTGRGFSGTHISCSGDITVSGY